MTDEQKQTWRGMQQALSDEYCWRCLKERYGVLVDWLEEQGLLESASFQSRIFRLCVSDFEFYGCGHAALCARHQGAS